MLKIGTYELTPENLSKLSLYDKIRIVISLFTVFPLLYQSPRIIKKLLKNTILYKEDANDEVIGFAYEISSRIPWYYRISDIIKKYGSYGYSYENGLGSSLKERFFHHYLTYGLLYKKLKIRRYTLLSVFLFLAALISIAVLVNNALLLLLIVPVILISPFFTFTYFTWSKPEILAWSFTPLLFYFSISNMAIPAAMILLALSFMSFTAVFFTSFSIFAFFLASGMEVKTFIFIFTPVAVKLIIDLYPFFKNIGVKTFENVLGGKNKEYTVTEGNTGLRPLELFFIILFSVVPVLLYTIGAKWPHIAMSTAPAVIMLINYKVYRLADIHTFFRLFLVLSTFLALIYPHYLYLAGFVIIMLVHPNLFEYGLNYYNKIEDGLHEYPLINPVKIGHRSIEKTDEFFSNAEKGSRIAFEADRVTIKNIGGYASFGSLAEYITFDKELEILPDEWIKLYHREFFINRLSLLNASSSVETISEVCNEAGINYLLCYTDSFVNKLIMDNFKIVAELDYKFIQTSCVGEMATPKNKLYLIQVPFKTDIIEPITAYTKSPNKIEFDAKEGMEYIIKYTHHPDWRAFQDEEELKIDKIKKNGLSFMKLNSKSDKKIIMEFS